MPAIVTNKFRIANAANFKTQVDLGKTYIYIGKSDAWSDTYTDTTDVADPATPLDTLNEESDVHDNMIAMKKIITGDISHVNARHNWVSGGIFVPYDDQDADIYDKAWYCVTDQFKVYACVNVTAAAAGVVTKPVHVQTSYAVKESDGYTWKYMYTLQASDANKFLTTNYMPVKTVVSANNGVDLAGVPDDKTQWDAQEAAETNNNGSIYRIVVVGGGTDYDFTGLAVTITGNGSGASVVSAVAADDVTITAGVITEIQVQVANRGANYEQANVAITHTGHTGTVATARAVLSPGKGHGSDPVANLGAFYMSTNVQLTYGDGSGDFITDNAFRQVGIIQSPFNYGTEVIATDTTVSALRSLNVTAANVYVKGDVISGDTSGAIAFIDSVNTATNVIKYHQNFKTGWVPFQAETTTKLVGTGTAGAGAGTINSLVAEEYERFTGDILFIENRDPVNRSTTQIEDVKIIIEF
jgi:hypothetical protein